MQDILKEYGPALITVVAVIALVTLVAALVGTSADSVVGKAFSGMLNDFFLNASKSANLNIN